MGALSLKSKFAGTGVRDSRSRVDVDTSNVLAAAVFVATRTTGLLTMRSCYWCPTTSQGKTESLSLAVMPAVPVLLNSREQARFRFIRTGLVRSRPFWGHDRQMEVESWVKRDRQARLNFCQSWAERGQKAHNYFSMLLSCGHSTPKGQQNTHKTSL
jgi:hypothetical protein